MLVLHFSDLHLNIPPTQTPWRGLREPKRAVGLLGMVLNRHARLARASEITLALLEEIEQIQPDLILFSGDMTCLSLPEEFILARNMFGLYLDRPDFLGFPGNHDVYVSEAEAGGWFSACFRDWLRSDLPRYRWPLPIVRFLGERHVVVAVSSARPTALLDSSGRVSREALVALDEILSRPEMARRHVILALHYGLVRPSGAPDSRLHGLRNCSSLLRVISGRVSMVVHGHMHRRFVLRHGSKRTLISCAGSISDLHRDTTFHLYRFDGDRVELGVQRFERSSGGFTPWEDAPGAGSYELL